MLLIVAHHYVVNSGLMVELAKDPLNSTSLFYYIFGMWGKVGINCFVLITGYFMCKSQINLRKFLKLFFEVFFYNFFIYMLFVCSGIEIFSCTRFIKSILPIQSVFHDFTSCFLLFYLFIPFLNILVSNLNKKTHAQLCMLCLFIYTLLPTLGLMYVMLNYITWFCVLYFISSYIRYYGLINKYESKHWGGLAILSILAAICSVLILLIKEKTSSYDMYRFVVDSNAVFAVLVSVTSFMFFLTLRIYNYKLINKIAASTFGVLLIHANSDTMRQWLWNDVLKVDRMYYSDYTCIYATCNVFLIFCVCIVIDYVRIHTIERWIFKKIDYFITVH